MRCGDCSDHDDCAYNHNPKLCLLDGELEEAVNEWKAQKNIASKAPESDSETR